MNYYDRAKELAEQTVAHRRYMHTNAEAGLDLPKTKAYVMEQLRSFGIEPKDCGYGVTATLGKGGKVLLLRMHFQWEKRVEKNLLVQQEKQHILAGMTSMQLCYLQQQEC